MTEFRHENAQLPLNDPAVHQSGSETPTLHESPIEPEHVDVPLSEKRQPEDLNPDVKLDKQSQPSQTEEENVLIVDWDGPNDPQNPKK